jgi:hypothetical protein
MALDFRNCCLPYVQQSRQLLLRDAEVALVRLETPWSSNFIACVVGFNMASAMASARRVRRSSSEPVSGVRA